MFCSSIVFRTITVLLHFCVFPFGDEGEREGGKGMEGEERKGRGKEKKERKKGKEGRKGKEDGKDHQLIWFCHLFSDIE